MAYNKVFALHGNLKKTIDYAANKEKTRLQGIIEYAADDNKTEGAYETAINCPSVELASAVMEKTKQYWGKRNGVQGYHIIQSFLPGEGPAELIHQIGIEYANALFGDSFEVVVTTHLNKDHLHNHIVVNSVSFVDGHKLRFSERDYYEKIQKESNRIVSNHGLSVIEPDSKGKAYAEWEAEKKNKPTIRSQIRDDMDRMIQRSYTMNMFWQNLEQAGYKVNRKATRKYVTVTPPFGERSIRLDSLGKDYSPEAIAKRIEEGRMRKVAAEQSKLLPRHYYVKGRKRFLKRKITGFEALYFRYVYMLRTGKPKKNKALSAEMKKELTKLEQYDKQFLFLLKNRIQTSDQLQEKENSLTDQIRLIGEERAQLYPKRKQLENEPEQQEANNRIEEINFQLKQLRKELRMCQKIKNTAPWIQAQQQMIQEQEKEHERYMKDRNCITLAP